MLLIAFTSPHHQDVTNTTNIKLSPLPPPIHHSNHLHEYHLYKYHRYKHPPPSASLLQKYSNRMNECDNKTHCTNESNMLTIKRIQTGPPSEKYVPCVRFTTLHSTLCAANKLLRLTVYCKLRLFVFKIPDNKRLISQKIFEQFIRHGS